MLLLILALPLGCSQDMDLSYEEQLAKDVAALDAYLTSRSITATKDPSGLRYVVTTLGSSTVYPTLSSSIKVKYTGYLFSTGAVFDQATTPTTFKLSDLIKGWQIALPLVPKGTQIRLYVPSGIAYGTKGAPPTIGANANLVFDIELVDVL